jgi:SAM-dependent methyltransferase
VTGGMETWWQGALAMAPLRWEDRRALYHEPNADIPVDREGSTDRSRWSNMRRYHFEWLAAKLSELPDHAKFVDLGAGPVQFADLTGRFDVCHIDHFPYDPVNVVTDITEPLPLSDDCADALMLSNVLEHVYRPDALLGECARILKPGGALFLVVPFFIKEHQSPYDFFRYTRFALRRLTTEAGFAEPQVEPIGNLFDIYDVDTVARANLIRARLAGPPRLAARCLLKIQSLAESGLRRLVPSSVAAERDGAGFAQSFGLLAEKART